MAIYLLVLKRRHYMLLLLLVTTQPIYLACNLENNINTALESGIIVLSFYLSKDNIV